MLPGALRLLVPFVLSFLVACGSSSSADDPATEATKIWNSRCANCHGANGDGKGPSAAALDPKPRSFRAAGWQAGVTDDHIREVIVGGGAAAGLSPSMAPNADLDGKDAVLDALVRKIRGMAG